MADGLADQDVPQLRIGSRYLRIKGYQSNGNPLHRVGTAFLSGNFDRRDGREKGYPYTPLPGGESGSTRLTEALMGHF